MVNEDLYIALKNEYHDTGKVVMEFTQEKDGKIFMTAKIPYQESTHIVIFPDMHSSLNVVGKWQDFPAEMIGQAVRVFENARNKMINHVPL